MNVFYSLIFIILLLGILIQPHKSRRKKKIYCSIVSISLILVSGLRHLSVGTDTWNYVNMFYTYNQIPLNEVFQHSFNIEIGYVLLNKIIGTLYLDHQLLLMFAAVIFIFSITLYIYKYSKDVVLSYLVLFSFSFFQFSMTGIRQTLAISIVIFAIKYALERNLFKFIFIILLASTFHQSALVALLIYPVTNFKLTKISKTISVVFLGITYVFRDRIIVLLFMFMPDERYNYLSEGGGETVLVIMVLLLVTGLIFQRYYENESSNSDFEYGLLIMGVFFQIFTPIQNIFFRIAMYFTIILLIFIPNLFSGFNSKERTLMKYAIYVALLIQYFVFTINSSGVIPYTPFWQ